MSSAELWIGGAIMLAIVVIVLVLFLTKPKEKPTRWATWRDEPRDERNDGAS